MSKFYYAVQKGRTPGIYESWEDCKREVMGYPAAVYKKFKTEEEARAFAAGGSTQTIPAGSRPASADRDISLRSLPDANSSAYAYVDGSFNSVSKVYGYGVILLLPDGTERSFQGSGSDPELASMRNVSGEIHGSMRAVTECEKLGLRSVTIFYDYMGIQCWAEGSWKRNKEGTRHYYEFMQEKKKSLDIRFQKVKAHSGVKYNELVDKLAKEAVDLL